MPVFDDEKDEDQGERGRDGGSVELRMTSTFGRPPLQTDPSEPLETEARLETEAPFDPNLDNMDNMGMDRIDEEP